MANANAVGRPLRNGPAISCRKKLIDYWGYQPSVTFGPTTFDIPANCQAGAPEELPSQGEPRSAARRQAAANVGSGRTSDR
jgi:hypothetical protein